jgi:DNA polymerase III delta subunit
MALSWKNPQPVVAIGGNATFLVGREIRNAVLLTERSGRRVIWAQDDAEVVDTLTMASTFGEACLVIVDAEKISLETIREVKENPPPKTGVLIHVQGKFEGDIPVLQEVHAGFQVQHNLPTKKKDLIALCVRFARAEAASLLGGNKNALDEKLAEALVKNVGADLGTVAFEISKMAALARSQGKDEITLDHVKELIRPSTIIDLQPLRDALLAKNAPKMAQALDRIRRTTSQDPVMLILRGNGSAGDLALKWLRTAVLLEGGASLEEIAARTNTPVWATKRDLIPGAKRWGASALRDLVMRLGKADRGVLLGSPAPWVSVESALLLSCTG